jgi:membrane fusion protein (multidrug efflux system)
MISFLHRSLLTVLTATVWVACQPPRPPVTDLVPEVNTIAAVSRNVPEYTEYIGQTYGAADVTIFSRVEGWVTAIHFKEGQEVKAGQLLYTIDDSQLRNQVDAVSAQLAQQEVLLAKTKADLDRVEPLAAINALSKRDLDAARAAYEAQSKGVEVSRANLRNVQLQASYCRITSPVTGTIGISTVQVGDLVSRTSRSLNTVSSTGEIRIRFAIPETDFLKYQAASNAGTMNKSPEVEVILSDKSVFPERAVLDFTDRGIDPKTGSLMAQAIVANKSVSKLRPGPYVKVRAAATELSDAVLVPQQAVNQLQTIHQVFVIGQGDTLKVRPVQTGPRIGSNWVISGGLKAGERVAIIGSMNIKPNSVVKPIPFNWSYDSTLVQ